MDAAGPNRLFAPDCGGRSGAYTRSGIPQMGTTDAALSRSPLIGTYKIPFDNHEIFVTEKGAR